MESAHSEVQFLGGALDLLNFIGDAQCAQVHHDADADSASHIGWARSQIAPLGVERKVKAGAECGVHAHRGVECLAEQVAGTQHLNAHVVFLIHHEGETLVRSHCHRARRITLCKLSRDQVSFPQQLSIALGQCGKVNP